MNILLTAKHYAVASGRYMHDALIRAGHTVRTVGPAMGVHIWGHIVDEKHVWTPNPPEKGWEPDLVLHMDATWIWDPPEHRFGDCPHVVYGVDNHVQPYDHVYRPDHLFLAHGAGYRMNEPDVTWLPCAYDPVWFTPGPPLVDRPHDVALIGWLNDDRNTAIHELVTHIRPINFPFGTGAVYDDFAATYQRSKVSLVVSVYRDVAQRVFETAAMGCVLVMDDAHDCERLGLVHGENCLIYPWRDFRRAAELVQWTLDNPDEAQRIASAGQTWAQPHTWDARAAFIVDWLEKERAPEKPKAKSQPKAAEKAVTSD